MQKMVCSNFYCLFSLLPFLCWYNIYFHVLFFQHLQLISFIVYRSSIVMIKSFLPSYCSLLFLKLFTIYVNPFLFWCKKHRLLLFIVDSICSQNLSQLDFFVQFKDEAFIAKTPTTFLMNIELNFYGQIHFMKKKKIINNCSFVEINFKTAY